jgi:hypothetical protein
MAYIGAALLERTGVGRVRWEALPGFFHEQHHLHYWSCGRCGRGFGLFWAPSLGLRQKADSLPEVRFS